MGDKASQTPEGSTETPRLKINGDSLFLQNSDHPGMVLVTTPLTGSNYMSWSRSINLALGAKEKLGFLNGRYEKPIQDSVDYDKWIRADCMVTSWILNSISKDRVEALLYANSARELWLQLEERFGEWFGPLLYQLQRGIYFTRKYVCYEVFHKA